MQHKLRVATITDIPAIRRLIQASVRGLQAEYTDAQREAALRTVFTVDTRLVSDGTYFVVEDEAGALAACGGWSFRKTLYGGDHQLEAVDAGTLDPMLDAAKVRAIFVHPGHARQGLGSQILRAAEQTAFAAGFKRLEMGSTLAGVQLYALRGWREMERVQVPVGEAVAIEVVRMVKEAN